MKSNNLLFSNMLLAFDVAARLQKEGASLARGMADMPDALDRKRGKGPQQVVRVERVMVAPDGQAIAGNVLTGMQGGRANGTIDEEPHAPPAGLAHDAAEDWRVTQMKFAKGSKSVRHDKTTVIYKHNVTLRSISLEAYDYVVNGKPALEWVIERQAVTTHKESGIVNDANDWANEPMHNPAYPMELFQRVITVSLETMKIVNGLPELGELNSASR